MASLKNINKDLLFKLTLYPNPDSYNWITYKIEISSLGEKSKKKLLELSQEGLYLEVSDMQELQIFCANILGVVDGVMPNFFFEPIDQDEFKFEIKNIDGKFFVSVYSAYFKILDTYKWSSRAYLGIKIEVGKDDIVDFVKQLENEFSEIEKKFPSKTFLE